MFYQNGHQPPPYGQQPPYPQQNNLPYGGYNGGGVGSASASSASGDAILEFPSPYGGPPPIFGGGYPPSGPPAGNTYGAPQQQSTYAPMPHFTPQQPQPQPSNPPAQQPAPPPAGGKPLFQPSGMIRSRKPVTGSGPVESVLSPPSSANSAAASPSSPVPPLAASASMPLVPSLSSDYEDYSLASAPPAYYQAYGAQNYGQQAPSHEYQVAPDIYRVTAPPPYHHQQQPQQQQPQQPTPYHSMPVLPQNRLYPSFSAPGLLNEHTQQHQQQQQQQQQQHFPSSPQVPPQQHYHPAPQLSQSQPQISHHYHPAPQPQPHQQQQQQQAAEETKPGSAAAAATGMKVLPPLPPDRRRNTVNLSPRQQRLKEQQQQKLQQPQRVSSDPSPQHQMSELEEKLRDRENKAKQRESVNAVVASRRQLAGLSLNASAPPTSTAQPLRAAAAAAAAGPEEKRRGSGPPAPTTTTAAAAAATVEDLYVAPPSFVLQPESRQPLSTGGGGGGASKKEPETQEAYNYYDLRSVHDSDSEEDSDDDDDDDDGGGKGGGGDAEANYVANIELKVVSADSSPLPSGYALPVSGEWPAKVKAKPEGDKADESPKVKAGAIRQSAKRGNRWEIEFEELEVDKRIGQGAYGSVFKGKWRNTVVAIKTIRENMASFHEAKFKEFRGEAEMMMDMRPHTNVVQLFGVCMRPYMAIVVEFLEGGSLQELLQSKADIDLHMALKIALHAAAGVAHLHAEGICHRDLAARNLLLTSRNKDYLVVKVADFGLSRFTEDAEDNFTSCKVGPLKWMPPESLQEQKYSSKSDAWAMGVVLWELFSRQEPFPGVSPVQVAIGVSSRGMCLRPPSSCPPEIARLMYDCWAYDPKERPDFRTIARTIEQVLDSNPENYNIVPNTGEPISCTHPKRQGSAKPAPLPRPTTTGQ